MPARRHPPASPLGALSILAGQGTDPLGRLYRRERGLPEWILLYTRDGRCFFRSGKKQFVATTEDLILLKPGQPHEYGPYGSDMYWRPIWVHFQPRPFWLPWLEWPQALPGVLRLTLDDAELRLKIATRLEAVVSHAAVNHPMYEDLAMNALEEALLWCRRAYQMAVIVPRDQRIDRVVRYISENPELPTTVTDMARISHLSLSRFAHRFRQVMGQTPLHFLEQMRMRRAVQLLRCTVQPVTEIAAASGFEDPLYFAKRFKRLTGTTPTEFRRSTKAPVTAAAAERGPKKK